MNKQILIIYTFLIVLWFYGCQNHSGMADKPISADVIIYGGTSVAITSAVQVVRMGSYTIDFHNAQRYITPEGYVQNEGDIGVHPEKSYHIELGSILPKKEECANLLVPVAVSSSHIAFGSIRMEPVFMILGQSASTIAVLALEKNIGIHDLSYEEIKTRLNRDGQILKLIKD